MNLNFLQCHKYRRLSYIQRDRELSETEEKFLRAHEQSCTECRRSMAVASLALNMLKDGAMEEEIRPNFDERLMRRFEVDTVRTSARYWSPAVLGAAVAGLVVLAAMQMIAQSSRLPTFRVPGGEARLSSPAIPPLHNLDFHRRWQ